MVSLERMGWEWTDLVGLTSYSIKDSSGISIALGLTRNLEFFFTWFYYLSLNLGFKFTFFNWPL